MAGKIPLKITPTTVHLESTVRPLSEEELRKQVRSAQERMGIPTDQEYDPLRPGGNDQELWPAQPGEAWFDFRLV
jgi:hypothetical protein